MIVAIQETKLTSKSKTPDFRSRYKFIRQDRPNNKPGGGLAFIIHESIEFRIIPQHSDEVLETQGIKVKFGNLELKIFNIFLLRPVALQTTKKPSKACSRIITPCCSGMPTLTTQPGSRRSQTLEAANSQQRSKSPKWES